MISMIIMVIVFLGFASIISYSVMTMNQNLIVTGNIETTNNELKTIKQMLISDAKPIESSDDYSLAYGSDDVSNNRHTLPTHLNIPLKNIEGFFYQYCPYAIVDGTNKLDTISQNGGGSYLVSTKEINSISYVTHSEQAHSLVGAPDVLGFILSATSDVELDCRDVFYDVNIGTFYADDAKVSAITKTEVQQYNKLNNLSGVTESLTISSSNYSDVFGMIENDVSNKSYDITLSNNVSVSGNYNFNRKPNKQTVISFDLNGHRLSGNSSFSMQNISFDMVGNNSGFAGDGYFPRIELTDSKGYFNSAIAGSLTVNNSDVILDNTSIESAGAQPNFKIFNSSVAIRNNSFFLNGSIANKDAVLELEKSELVIEDGATLDIIKKKGTFDYLIKLSDSTVSNFGTIKENDTISITTSDNSIFIDGSSEFYLYDGLLEVKGNLSSNGNAIIVKGALITEGDSNVIRATSGSNLENLILVKGGELSLDGVRVGQSSNISNTTIKENDTTSNSRGIAKVSGDAIIYQGTNGCFEGEIFKKSYTVDNGYKREDSGSDIEVNNLSSYTCN